MEYYRDMFQIIKTGHWITDQVGKALKEDDISEPQFNVLRILKGAGGAVPVGHIAENMIQRNINVTRILDKLVAKGYCSRELNPENRRQMKVKITKAGEKKLLVLNKKVDELHRPFKNKLSKQELVTLEQLILKLKS